MYLHINAYIYVYTSVCLCFLCHTLQLHPKSYGVMCEERVRFTQDAGAKRDKLQVTFVFVCVSF